MQTEKPAPALSKLAWCDSTNGSTPEDKSGAAALSTNKSSPAGVSNDSRKPAAQILKDAFSAFDENAPDLKNKAFANPLATWHKQFAQDLADPNWSAMAQAQAESYLSGMVGAEIELISVKCTGTVCEIRAASTSAENSQKAAKEWQAGISAMSNEPWWSTYGFASPTSAIWAADDGRALLVSYLTRDTQ